MGSTEKYGKTIGLLLAVLYFLFFQEHPAYQWIVFALILITVGIPHGAIDHLLVKEKGESIKPLEFYLKYLGTILLYLLVWWLSPKLALFVFLVISSFHFGQAHFTRHSITDFRFLTYFLLGAFFLALIILSDFAVSRDILLPILDIGPIAPYALWIILFLGLISFVLTSRQKIAGKGAFFMEIVLLSVLLYFLPVLMGFILYFGFWHSLPSMQEEFEVLMAKQKSDKIFGFIKKLLPFSLLSLGGLALILYFSSNRLETDQLTLLLFVMVSLITAPHVWVMDRFLENKKN
ncbi:Brp/Blh family beta-carotene 15,15'-dioxygenase [Pararhodonellum marinum]|uniref:Brp/Blh family beta-carotene 15,15'-dioxygenase n=1 Tax=Pararhodonellum marinum TaxID=2755358 RepID=UPI00188E10EC|nr:Brp/Blh family beta-carotene 15,15'-dioxygenase [Pararhodonellum marinum]